jgi:hypothetical protein
MRSIKAIYIKQAKDLIKTPMVSIQFIIFPAFTFVLTELVAKSELSAGIPENMFVIMFSCIFAGMVVLMTTAGFIAEDKEQKSVRFLVMAGVKPHEYLIGTGGVVLTACAVVSAAFGLMGGFTLMEFGIFMAAMMSGSVASVLLGATIGMCVKNQQSATGLGMPVAMILGFSPMIGMFNATAKKLFGIFYTMQVDTIVNDFSANLAKPFFIILANILLLAALFTFVYKKKGLRE